MDKELTIIAEPEELIAWADTFDILLNPSIEDAAILLNYMEGHDYAIGIDSDGKMYRQDVAEENGEIEPYPIDDVIDIVCEWNYELILDAEAHRSDPKDFNDYNEYQSKYESLKADEKRLDRLFDKTSYGKELIEVATELADRVIAQLGNKELEKVAVTVAEGVQCEFCGKFAPASAFASYGGFGKLNKGKCYECSRNPNINTEVNVSEEKARQKQRYDPDICPECGGRLRLIQGPFGKFMGCEDYPTCKFNRRVRKK